MKKIFLCDLTHTTQGNVSEFIPYGIGCIKAYFYKFALCREEVDIQIFKFPNLFVESLLRDKPDVVAFSNYVWNIDLSYSFAKEIKNLFPNVLIIFGGPNYPLEDNLREKWLKHYKSIDLYIVGEGEKTFQEVIDTWYKSKDIEQVKCSKIDGLHSIVKGKFYKSNDIIPRLDNLDLIPSPYLSGYFDKFLEDENIIPLTETNRGCPFTCTYCERGSKHWMKISKRSVANFSKEIEYIATRCKNKVLQIADSNFGIYSQDIDISKQLSILKDKYNYPLRISVSTGKNVDDKIITCASILRGSLPVTASVQSLDPTVLKNVKRKNISTNKLFKIAKSANSSFSATRSEIILALPGDTKKNILKQYQK